jgi:OFA family oxalate/formate antiporter-like MFS transporter
LLSNFLRPPQAQEVPPAVPRKTQTTQNYAPIEVLRSPVFWVRYVMFVLVAASGLMVTAQIAPIAKDLKIGDVPLDLGFVVATALTVALVVDNVLNGLARPFFGWVSDHLGRENTMAMVFSLGALSYWGLGTFGSTPALFVITAGLVYFTWGEIYSLFPATCTDSFGAKFATVNAGLLYTAKGTSAWLVPLANVLKSHTGSWHAVFVAAALMNLAVALAAIFILKPMRAASLKGEQAASRVRAAE